MLWCEKAPGQKKQLRGDSRSGADINSQTGTTVIKRLRLEHVGAAAAAAAAAATGFFVHLSAHHLTASLKEIC